MRHPAGGAGATTRTEEVPQEQSAVQDPSADPAPELAADRPGGQGSGPAPNEQARTVPPAAEPDGGEQSPDSVDKIRDIIFGHQMRDYDTRFRRLEERLVREAGVLRDDTSRRFDALEAMLKKQVEMLGERLMEEEGSRTQATHDLSQGIAELLRHVDRRTTEMDVESNKVQQELWHELKTQAQALTDEIRSRFDAVSSTLDRQTTALRDEKTDRASLAALLTDMAERLRAGNTGA